MLLFLTESYTILSAVTDKHVIVSESYTILSAVTDKHVIVSN